MNAYTSAVIAAAVGLMPLLTGFARAGDPVPMTPLAVTWTFSADEGKTYTAEAPPAVKINSKVPVWGRGEFTVENPSSIGALWFATADAGGGVCPLNEFRIGHRYIAMPLILLDATLSLNGQTVPFEMDDVLVRRVVIDPSLLRPGVNEIVFQGNGWNSLHNAGGGPESPVAFRLLTTPPEALALRSGPALGPFGEDYFTLACRSWIPARLQVTVKPLDPVGKAKTFDFPRATLHHARLPVPAGTRRFEYTVTTLNGEARSSAGPWKVRLPDPAGNIKFIVMGQTAAHTPEKLYEAAASIRKAAPDFIIHTGSLIICTYWSFAWDDMFFQPFSEVLATTPLFIVPNQKDLYSMAFGRLFYYPTQDGLWDQWTWNFGPMRFIGLDGITCAQHAGPVAAWYEERLRESTEKFLFHVTSYPGYTTHKDGRGGPAYEYDAKTLHPLLARYHATASFGCTGKYEFVPAANDQAVPSIVTGGVGAPMAPGWTQYNYCLVEIKDDQCTVRAVAYETGAVLDTQTFKARKQPGVR